MVKLQVVRVKDGMAECKFSYSKAYKDLVLKELGVKYASKRIVGRFLEESFRQLSLPTPKKRKQIIKSEKPF